VEHLKGLPETHGQAYYEKWQLTAVKSFITLAPGGSMGLRYFLQLLFGENSVTRLGEILLFVYF
jgi:hypothetical protein